MTVGVGALVNPQRELRCKVRDRTPPPQVGCSKRFKSEMIVVGGRRPSRFFVLVVVVFWVGGLLHFHD